MKQSFLTTICLGLITSLPAAEPELKGTVAEVRHHLAASDRIVSVPGEAEVKGPADRAIVTLRLTAESRSLHDALKANQTLRTKLVATLTGRGIGADRIDAGKFSSTPRNWVFSDKVKNYKVETLVKVTVLNEGELQDTARMLDELNGVEYAGLAFEHSKKEELKRRALSEALDAANARKKVYEEQLGIALIPYKFTENVAIADSRLIGAQSGSEPSFGKSGSTPLGYSTAYESASGFGEKVFAAQVLVQYTVGAR